MTKEEMLEKYETFVEFKQPYNTTPIFLKENVLKIMEEYAEEQINSLTADIRNKLSPVKNLCAMLKKREIEPYEEKNDKINKLIDKEIEQCLISVKYLSNL